VKRVYRAASLLQVAHARNVLMGELPMMETWPQLYVDDADEKYALSLLAGAAKAPGGAPWVCEGCLESLEQQFTTCWRCGRERSSNAGI
jgi:hypothetical protein